MNMNKRITVIGGGPGGYVAAIRAAQLGADVVLVEKERIGGTCLNVGCIPAKALLDSAHVFYEAGHSSEIGVMADPILDWEKVQSRRKNVIKRLVRGVESLLKTNKIRVIKGSASFDSPSQITVTDADGRKESVESDYFIIATGSEPSIPPIPGIDGECCIDSTGALELDHVPESLIVIGGGVIGIELATAYHHFGTKVCVVEMMDHILPNIDTELSEALKKDMIHDGVDIRTATKVCSVDGEKGSARVLIEHAGNQENITAETVLVCIGRRSRIKGLDLEKAGVKYERGICVDEYLRTSADNIYAIGDCNGKQMLAHAASEQGMIAAENCMGMEQRYDGSICPAGVYSSPEIASVGISEDRLKEAGIEYRKGVFPLMANGRSLIHRCKSGIVKVLTGEKDGKVLGVHIYGPQATEIIHEAVIAMEMKATAGDLAKAIHAHPTVSEAIHEAALGTENRMIHMPNNLRRLR